MWWGVWGSVRYLGGGLGVFGGLERDLGESRGVFRKVWGSNWGTWGVLGGALEAGIWENSQILPNLGALGGVFGGMGEI